METIRAGTKEHKVGIENKLCIFTGGDKDSAKRAKPQNQP